MKKTLDPEAAAIGQRVRAARLGRNLTLEQLAEAADTSTQFLSNVEKGAQTMTLPKFIPLVRALGVSSDYLLFGRAPLDDRAALAAEYLSGLNPVERDLLLRTVIDLRGVLDELAPECE